MRVTRALRCQPSSQIEDRSEASRISSSAGEATRPKIVATEKIVKYFTIRTVLGIGTGNSSAVVSVVLSDRSSKRGALLGPKRHPNRQDRTSTGVFFFFSRLVAGRRPRLASSLRSPLRAERGRGAQGATGEVDPARHFCRRETASKSAKDAQKRQLKCDLGDLGDVSAPARRLSWNFDLTARLKPRHPSCLCQC